MSEEEKKPKNVGVRNPYALAELKIGKPVNWKSVKRQKLLEDTLGLPYEKLFDPKFDSPLYAGLEYDPDTKTMKNAATDPCEDYIKKAVWADPGDFFEMGTELTDPTQGAVGDCYFISALSSVAWARPYIIAERTRKTGTGPQDFVDVIEFYNKGKQEMVEVSEKIPLYPPNNTFIYAHSNEVGEIWPAIYEKAFAKWVLKDPGDQPDICKIAGGDPVGALNILTGFTPYYYDNRNLSEDQIWQKVRENCISYKTFNPMVAWTYPSSPSPDVNYNNAHIAANHAYSILGWQYADNQKYIVLRNPWGTYEATVNIDGHTWMAWDQPYYGSGKGFWRPIQMSTPDGIFALRVDTFKKYFVMFGNVKTPEAPQ